MLLLLLTSALISQAISATIASSLGVESQVGRQLIFDLDGRLTCFYESLENEMMLKLTLEPYPRIKSRFPLQLRLTSPSGEFSEWVDGNGEIQMPHNVTEDGDYEICLLTPRPIRVALNIFFHNPQKVEKAFEEYLQKNNLGDTVQKSVSQMFQYFYNIKYSIKFYNQISVRDEAMQELNGSHVQLYSTIFCIAAVIISLVQVYAIRRMFRIDTKRIRI